MDKGHGELPHLTTSRQQLVWLGLLVVGHTLLADLGPTMCKVTWNR